MVSFIIPYIASSARLRKGLYKRERTEACPVLDAGVGANLSSPLTGVQTGEMGNSCSGTWVTHSID